MSGYEHPLIRHIPDECYSQLHRCKNLKTLVLENHLFAYSYSNTDTQSSTVTVRNAAVDKDRHDHIWRVQARDMCYVLPRALAHSLHIRLACCAGHIQTAIQTRARHCEENGKRIQNAYLLKEGKRTCS